LHALRQGRLSLHSMFMRWAANGGSSAVLGRNLVLPWTIPEEKFRIDEGAD
jgi:hypothetical protein